EAPLFLFVGNGFERKGVPQLLRAFSRMQRRDAWLLIVGGDRRLAAAQQLARRLGIAERVRFAGAQKDVKPFYGAADAFALPTLYDPFPNAALEALACGLPLLVSNSCGTAELIVEGSNGFVGDALDENALAGALDRLAENSPILRQAARATAETLPLEAMSEKLMALYRQIGATAVVT
ncbi:glycosyltransferase family 4 protein, partial [bacterium]|nr:glycosyltransferase family 4 protein [bacterium]